MRTQEAEDLARADVRRAVVYRQVRAMGLRELLAFDGVSHQPSPRGSTAQEVI
jgi:hypothetical protein